jgi:hypothetical protein
MCDRIEQATEQSENGRGDKGNLFHTEFSCLKIEMSEILKNKVSVSRKGSLFPHSLA